MKNLYSSENEQRTTSPKRTYGGLVGFDLGDGIAGRKGLALLDVPLGDGAGLHGRGEGGHAHHQMIRQVVGRQVPNLLLPSAAAVGGRFDRQRRRGEDAPARQ